MKDEKNRREIKVIVKPPNMFALKQFAQDILNAIEKYEKSVEKESTKEDGK